MNGRMAKTGSRGGTSAKGGKLQKASDGHAKPGQNFPDPKAGTWPARTGYTSQSRMGPGSHGSKINVGGS